MRPEYRPFLVRATRFLLIAALLSGGWTVAARAQDAVRVAVGVDPVFTPWWIADQKGFFKKYNVKADITRFSGGPDLADAVMAGEADFGSSGTATWMPRLARGSLLVLGAMAKGMDNYKMAALTSIKTLEDLRGKKLGTVGGSSTDYLWALVGKKIGVGEDGLDLTPIPPPELVSSLDRGDISAFFVWEPWASKAVEVSGKDKVHILASNADVGYFSNVILVGNEKFIRAKPEVTVHVLAAVRDATDYMAKNPDETVRIAAETNKLTQESARNITGLYKYALNMPDDLADAAKHEEDWMRSKSRLKGSPIDWKKTLDRSYLDQAMAMK